MLFLLRLLCIGLVLRYQKPESSDTVEVPADTYWTALPLPVRICCWGG